MVQKSQTTTLGRTLEINGINYQPQSTGERRISEPSNSSMKQDSKTNDDIQNSPTSFIAQQKNLTFRVVVKTIGESAYENP